MGCDMALLVVRYEDAGSWGTEERLYVERDVWLKGELGGGIADVPRPVPLPLRGYSHHAPYGEYAPDEWSQVWGWRTAGEITEIAARLAADEEAREDDGSPWQPTGDTRPTLAFIAALPPETKIVIVQSC